MRLRSPSLCATTLALTFTLLGCGMQSQPPEITLDDANLSAKSGMYTDTIALGEIDTVTLEDTFPRDGASKTNGFDYMTHLRGSWELSDGTPARLYIDTATPPFVRVDKGDTAIYLNHPDPNDTRKLHDDLVAKIEAIE